MTIIMSLRTGIVNCILWLKLVFQFLLVLWTFEQPLEADRFLSVCIVGYTVAGPEFAEAFSPRGRIAHAEWFARKRQQYLAHAVHVDCLLLELGFVELAPKGL